ncbi:hypothetical protein L596_006170 [Steinernema carpocapsae]|uniref:DUF7808 domain-containing protein n=1 Tax=Steinernema carpocapsae TaxID=34508 RepID=A0A4U8V2Q7_STECR|nr:hypothetical protein L596_006170 [Steinernema carpocapsae]
MKRESTVASTAKNRTRPQFWQKNLPGITIALRITRTILSVEGRIGMYLWRSKNCMSTTISFEIRCGFPRDPRVFYRENQHLFEYEDAQ